MKDKFYYNIECKLIYYGLMKRTNFDITSTNCCANDLIASWSFLQA